MAGSSVHNPHDGDVGRLYPKVVFIPWKSMAAFTTGAVNEGGSATFAVGALEIGVGAGAPIITEIGSLGICAPVMVANDELDHAWVIPHDVNWSLEIGIRLVYNTASTSGSDTSTWVVLADVIAEGSAHAIATTALDTTIAVDTDSGVANAWERTSRGVIDGGTLTEANVLNADFLSINIELGATGVSEAVHFWGILLDYMPKRYQGQVQSFQADLAEG